MGRCRKTQKRSRPASRGYRQSRSRSRTPSDSSMNPYATSHSQNSNTNNTKSKSVKASKSTTQSTPTNKHASATNGRDTDTSNQRNGNGARDGNGNGGRGAGGGGGSGPNGNNFGASSYDNICAICRSDIADLAVTNCNHRFCRECIGHWTEEHSTCPTCRTTINTIRINISPNGAFETIDISRAEILARKINETHSMLMLLFTVIAHSLLPEVSSTIRELDTVARDLNVPTTNSRAARAAEMASSASDTTSTNTESATEDSDTDNPTGTTILGSTIRSRNARQAATRRTQMLSATRNSRIGLGPFEPARISSSEDSDDDDSDFEDITDNQRSIGGRTRRRAFRDARSSTPTVGRPNTASTISIDATPISARLPQLLDSVIRSPTSQVSSTTSRLQSTATNASATNTTAENTTADLATSRTNNNNATEEATTITTAASANSTRTSDTNYSGPSRREPDSALVETSASPSAVTSTSRNVSNNNNNITWISQSQPESPEHLAPRLIKQVTRKSLVEPMSTMIRLQLPDLRASSSPNAAAPNVRDSRGRLGRPRQATPVPTRGPADAANRSERQNRMPPPPNPSFIHNNIRTAQRSRDIRHLSKSYRKINQVFEILQILHVLVHRNSVELDDEEVVA